MLTPFGIASRKLRLDRGLRLLDQARLTSRTSAFISAVETGKKNIPRGYVDQLAAALELDLAEKKNLQRAADQSSVKLELDEFSENQRELVAAFARKIDELPADFLEEVKKKVFKSSQNEVPFKRRRAGMLVAPASADFIWDFANQIRATVVPEDEIFFPIMDILEFRVGKFIEGFYLDVCSYEEMGCDEGRVMVGGNCIKLREDVYEGAWENVGRDRFTACHELGHFLLHRNVSLARMRTDSQPIYQDAEWQADTFAGGLLMSMKHLQKFSDANDAASKCGITPAAARVMWSKYEKKGLC